jgi:hypothetical protein
VVSSYTEVVLEGSTEVVFRVEVDEGRAPQLQRLVIEVFTEGRQAATIALTDLETTWLESGLVQSWNWWHDDCPEDAGEASWRGGTEGQWGPDLKQRCVTYLLGRRKVLCDFSDDRQAVVVSFFASERLDEHSPRHMAIHLCLNEDNFERLVEQFGRVRKFVDSLA